jgi:hypothetical protein
MRLVVYSNTISSGQLCTETNAINPTAPRILGFRQVPHHVGPAHAARLECLEIIKVSFDVHGFGRRNGGPEVPDGHQKFAGRLHYKGPLVSVSGGALFSRAFAPALCAFGAVRL